MGWLALIVVAVVAFVLGWATNDAVADQIAQITDMIR